MRPLVMDFRGDAKARDVQRRVHVRPGVPGQPGHDVQGAQPLGLSAARGRLVRLLDRRQRGRREGDRRRRALRFHAASTSGPASIVPTGPELQYTGEKPADPIVLWVYAGADGDFTLYEDDGLTYGYEKGASARIPLHWNDATQTLTIGKREGTFPGMPKERTFERGGRLEGEAGRVLVHAQGRQDRSLRGCGRRREAVAPVTSQSCFSPVSDRPAVEVVTSPPEKEIEAPRPLALRHRILDQLLAENLGRRETAG